MATLTPAGDLVALLAPGSSNRFELHLLCAWGIVPAHPESTCTCARLVKVTSTTLPGHELTALILEPGADHTEFWAAQAWADLVGKGVLLVGDVAWRAALAQC